MKTLLGDLLSIVYQAVLSYKMPGISLDEKANGNISIDQIILRGGKNMRTGKLIGILIVLVILSIFAVNTSTSSEDSNTDLNNAENAIIASDSDPIYVDISDLTFNPAQISVSAGTTVIWTNNDSVPHTVTSNTSVFDSGIFNTGQTFEWTFNQTGTFNYYCKVHPFMTGTVIVTETPTVTPDVTVTPNVTAVTPNVTRTPTVTPNVTVIGTPTVTVTVPPETRRVVEIVDNMTGVPLINQSTMDILAEDFINFNAGDRYNITVTSVSGGVVEYNASGVLMGGPKQTIKVNWTPKTQGAYILRSDANTTTEARIVQVINQKVISPIPELSTIALVSAGLLGLFGMARRRKNS